MEEAALVAVVLWGLPEIGVRLPAWVLAPASIALAVQNVFTYRKSVQALRMKPMPGLPDMVDSRGKVVSPLVPDGLVKIKGELWAAESASGEIVSGREVIVVKQNRLRLVVRENDQAEAEKST